LNLYIPLQQFIEGVYMQPATHIKVRKHKAAIIGPDKANIGKAEMNPQMSEKKCQQRVNEKDQRIISLNDVIEKKRPR
jgi:hypothetical protein